MPDFDAVIIGTGAGGGAAGYGLARAGKRVLFVERGNPLTDEALFQDERAMMLEGVAADDRPHRLNGRRTRLVTGSLPGGSTAIYGAALVRPAPEDFVPGRHYAAEIPRTIWEWPIDGNDLAPYFREAEILMQVASHGDEPGNFLPRPSAGFPPAPAFKQPNQGLVDLLTHRGFRPFHLPLAIDFNRCRHCPRCPGYVCPNGSRQDSAGSFVRRAVEAHHAVLWTGMECVALNRGTDGVVRSAELVHRASGGRRLVSADSFVIAAGAVGTPILLERSNIPDASGQRGGNYMIHLGAALALLFREPTGAHETWMKQLGLADFYFGTKELPLKMGLVQQLPLPGPMTLARMFPIPPFLARWIYRRTLVMAGTVEDLPRTHNRVRARKDGISITHRFDPFDLQRGHGLLAGMRRAFRAPKRGEEGDPLVRLHSLAFGVLGASDHRRNAHQVGTCRMHRDPAHGVVDAEGRVHGCENLHIADGSVLPTSLGVGPALTIYAWGLRVADRILARGTAP